MRLLAFLLSLSFAFPAAIRSVNLVNGKNYARVIIRLSSRVNYRVGRITRGGKTLLYVDMYGASPGRAKPRYYFKSDLVELIRVARQDRRRMRAVIYLREYSNYKVFFLPSPSRIVIDIYSKSRKIRVPRVPAVPAKKKRKTGVELPLSKQLGLKIKRIAIDPGHGGKDPGCLNKKLNLKEKDLALDIAITLKELLENDGYDVILTRDKDVFLSLEERPAIANSKAADLFVSIHVNWSRHTATRGIETFYLNFATDPEAERVAAKENEASSRSLSQLKDILKKIALNEKIRESRALSQFVQKGMVSQMRKYYSDINDLGVRGAPFFVLIGADMPATLVEVSFLSNEMEAHRLSDPIYRARIAYGIYRGIENFIKFLEGK